jgi:hypothetical protein
MRLNTKLKLTRSWRRDSRDRGPKHRRAIAAPALHQRREDLLWFPVAAGVLTSAPAYRRCR